MIHMYEFTFLSILKIVISKISSHLGISHNPLQNMVEAKRSLRSTAAVTPSTLAPTIITSPISFTTSSLPLSHEIISIVIPGSKLPGTTPAELRLLRQKQSRLSADAFSTLDSLLSKPHICNTLEASLIFAQHDAGSAVCVDPAGWVLTCAHCFGDTEAEWKANRWKWLLYYTGLAVQAECRIWDPKRDLALLKIVAIETGAAKTEDVPAFRSVSLSPRAPACKTPIVCIGQPGSEDLESASAQHTQYNLVELSEGTFCGMVPGVDPQDNSEIGALKHDAWTYWGHSGAPLLREADGKLLGLHSSWDDQTAMRHGIPLIAIKEFLQQHLSI